MRWIVKLWFMQKRLGTGTSEDKSVCSRKGFLKFESLSSVLCKLTGVMVHSDTFSVVGLFQFF